MINVYPYNETSFSSNGLATLEPISCELSMTINGAWTLTMEHPYDAELKFQNLEKGNIIQVSDINVLRNCSTSQRYRIYDTNKGIASMSVIAIPIGMEATYDAIISTKLSIKKKTGNQAVSLISSYLEDAGMTKYTLTASGLTKQRSVSYENTNLIAALCGSSDDSIVSKYNAQIAYNNYQIFVKKNIGSKTANYDVRIGKNLTGLSWESDDSAVVTRLYPISEDSLRYNEVDTGSSGNNEYIDSDNIGDYPHVRAAFVDVPYGLIDTNVDVETKYKTDTITATENAYSEIYDGAYAAIQSFWQDVYTDNEFTTTYEPEGEAPMTVTIPLVPEFVQDVIKDISTAIAEGVLQNVSHAGLKSWLTKAIRAGIDWIYDVDLPDKNWIQNQDGSYSYGNSLRRLTNEWAYIDKMMCYFDSNSKWVEEKDDPIPWDWIQKKGQSKKFGNNRRYLAVSTYVYTMSSDGTSFNKYWMDSEGLWDGESEESDWEWQGSGTSADPFWFGESGASSSDTGKFAHDTWLFIKATTSSASALYYFDSNGYLVDSLTTTVDWDWHEVKGKWYFGSTNKEYRAEYLVSQWLKIDGEWRYFDSNGYVMDTTEYVTSLVTALTGYLTDALESDITLQSNILYDLLYEHMEEYCEDLFEDGLDKPLINVSVDFVDLSKTQEYTAFSALETVCLGDSVKVTDDIHGFQTNEEVVGLTYDCIRGYNTKIEVGGIKSVSSLFDTSVKGSDSGQRLVAGENVTIDGGVINVSPKTGDVYAGDKVTVTPLQSTGNAIARISVNGISQTIYAIGTDVEVTPIKQSGDKIATITVGGVDYDIYADTGLKWWVETETDIYREGTRGGDLFAEDDSFILDEAQRLLHIWAPDYGYAHWIISKINSTPTLFAAFRKDYGTSQYGFLWNFMFVSPAVDPDYTDGVLWKSQKGIDKASALVADFDDPIEDYEESYLVKPRAMYTSVFTYKGVVWKAIKGNFIKTTTACLYEFLESVNVISITEQSDLDDDVALAKILIDRAGASTTTPDAIGISHNDHIFYYCPDFNSEDHDETKDSVYITKDGIVNASGFTVNGVAVGALYKTTLYQGTTYASSISLSDSYTSYDLLMFETYNADDKQNLASTVNVSDLKTASYIGVMDYLMYTITNGRTLTFHEAPDDTNHSRYVKAIYGLRTAHGSGEESPLEDVIVDGTSVVSGGVAVIDLSGKQDALTAGTNINISNGVISATDTTYSDFGGSTHGLVPEVQTQSGKYLKDDGSWDTPVGGTTYTAGANIQISQQNEISATDTTYSDFAGSLHGLVPAVQTQAGKYLKDDGTWDDPEGTTVEANPSGTATASLSKIQIDTTIYEIAGGGGGGSKTELYSGYAITGTITLNDDYSNYELLYIVGRGVGEISALVPTSGYGSTFGAITLSECSGGSSASSTNADMYVELIATNSTLLTIANSIGGIAITKIYGINGFGGGSGASALEDLTDVDITSPSNNQVLKYNSTSQKWENANASGGTTVVANPSGTATADLESLQVGNTIYSLPSGSGYSITKIWDYVEDNNSVIPYNTFSVTLSQSIDNFDEIIFENASSAADLTSSTWNQTNQIAISVEALKGAYKPYYFNYCSYDNRSVGYHVEGTTFAKIASNVGNTNGLIRVYGVKYSSGNSGSNALLFQGDGTSNPSQITLNDDYTNYDMLIFRTKRNADSRVYKTDKTFGVSGLETNDFIQDIGWAPDNNYWTYQIADSTTLNRIAQGSNYFLYEIYGVKL